jgi:hypothetical protein
MSRPVRIAMLDSGVFTGNAHIERGIAGGVTVLREGERQGFEDTLGHGTAICALLQNLAPDADLFAVKIFDQRLATSISTVLRAMAWCVREQMDIINLSLGTSNEAHRPQFLSAIKQLQATGAVLVSAYPHNASPMLPGSLPGVVGVSEDEDCPRDRYRVLNEGAVHLGACPFPLDIAGVPRERNLRGVSFSVAHISAQIAQCWPNAPRTGDWLGYLAKGHLALALDKEKAKAQRDRDQQAGIGLGDPPLVASVTR